MNVFSTFFLLDTVNCVLRCVLIHTTNEVRRHIRKKLFFFIPNGNFASHFCVPGNCFCRKNSNSHRKLQSAKREFEPWTEGCPLPKLNGAIILGSNVRKREKERKWSLSKNDHSASFQLTSAENAKAVKLQQIKHLAGKTFLFLNVLSLIQCEPNQVDYTWSFKKVKLFT